MRCWWASSGVVSVPSYTESPSSSLLTRKASFRILPFRTWLDWSILWRSVSLFRGDCGDGYVGKIAPAVGASQVDGVFPGLFSLLDIVCQQDAVMVVGIQFEVEESIAEPPGQQAVAIWVPRDFLRPSLDDVDALVGIGKGFGEPQGLFLGGSGLVGEIFRVLESAKLVVEVGRESFRVSYGWPLFGGDVGNLFKPRGFVGFLGYRFGPRAFGISDHGNHFRFASVVGVELDGDRGCWISWGIGFLLVWNGSLGLGGNSTGATAIAVGEL